MKFKIKGREDIFDEERLKYYNTIVDTLIIENDRERLYEGWLCSNRWCLINTPNITKIIFNDGVEEVPRGLCESLPFLTSVSFPNTLKYIGDYAFDNCISLKNCTLPKNLVSIGTNAFYETAITEVKFPKTLTRIDEYAFAKSKVKNVIADSESVIDIRKNAFNNTPFIRNKKNYEDGALYLGKTLLKTHKDYPVIKIKEGTQIIANNALYYAEKIDIPESLTTIKAQKNRSYNTTREFAVPSVTHWISITHNEYDSYVSRYKLYSKDGQPILNFKFEDKKIKRFSLANDQNIEDCILSDNTEIIANGAFRYSSIKNIQFNEAVKCIEPFAFSCCTNLEKVFWPKQVETIEMECFSGCQNLDISIPEGVKKISKRAFAYDKFDKLEIPKSVNYLANESFKYTVISDLYLHPGKSKLHGNPFIGATVKMLHIITPDGIEDYLNPSNEDIMDLLRK